MAAEKLIKNAIVLAAAAFFAVMWGLVIRQRIAAQQVDMLGAVYDTLLAPGQQRRESTFGIYFMGRRFGGTQAVVARQPDDSIRAESVTEIDVGPAMEPIIGVSGAVKIRFDVIVEPLSGIRHFSLACRELGVRLFGMRRGDELSIEGSVRGKTVHTALPFDQRQFLTGMFSPMGGLPELNEEAVGAAWRLHVVNPLLGGVERVTAKVESSMLVPTDSGTMRVFLISLSTSGSRWHTWVNADGEVLVQGTPIGLTLRREDIEPSVMRAILARESATAPRPSR